MKNRKIRVLHIVRDDKFFDGVINVFESDERFENRSVLFVKSHDYEFSQIKQTEKVELLWNKEMVRDCLQSSDYDAIFFHSLATDKYKIFRYIPKDKIVIWWCWGFDLYLRKCGMEPLIPVDLYKHKTKDLIKCINGRLKSWVKSFIRYIFQRPYYKYLRSKVIERIDYFQPVIPLEYQRMKNVRGFRAKEFYYQRYPTSYQPNIEHTLPADGGILIGNSTSPTNNHLDVWELIQPYLGEHRSVVMPLNYSSNKVYADRIADMITSDKHQIEKLRTFMPREEYFRLIDNCSYAVFGVMRQQAMGNIFHCLRRGVKIFLYKDSLVYQSLKSEGFVVYAIENVDDSSFHIPLTIKELEQNAKADDTYKTYVEQTRSRAIEEISNIIHSN